MTPSSGDDVKYYCVPSGFELSSLRWQILICWTSSEVEQKLRCHMLGRLTLHIPNSATVPRGGYSWQAPMIFETIPGTVQRFTRQSYKNKSDDCILSCYSNIFSFIDTFLYNLSADMNIVFTYVHINFNNKRPTILPLVLPTTIHQYKGESHALPPIQIALHLKLRESIQSNLKEK